MAAYFEETEEEKLDKRLRRIEHRLDFLMRSRFGWWRYQTEEQRDEELIKMLAHKGDR
jgi:hypothetical protein